MIEITEETLVDNELAVGEAIAALRARRVRVAVDDIGAGYSGLRQVTTVAPDYMKLDRSLVSGIDTDDDRAALVAALCGYAAQVGSLLVAEGVEFSDELARLRSLRVPLAQGFLLAGPGRPWSEPSRVGTGSGPNRRSPASGRIDRPGARRNFPGAARLAAGRRLGGEPGEDGSLGVDGEHRRHHRDPVLAGEVGALADVDLDQRVGLAGQPALPLVAFGAERVGELDVGAAGERRRADVGGLDVTVVARRDPAQAGAEAVDLAARAEPGHRRQQGQGGDDRAEVRAERRHAHHQASAAAREEDAAHDVGQARRPGVLQLALAHPGLDQGEVGDAERHQRRPRVRPRNSCSAHQRPQQRPAEDDAGERHQPDHGLVEAGRVGVDDVRFVPGIGAARLGHRRSVRAAAAAGGGAQADRPEEPIPAAARASAGSISSSIVR